MTYTPRRISEFLPEVLQTDMLRKFFAATGDHLFQPDRVEYLSAYIGDKPAYYNPTTDKYVSEITKNRQVYQVAPTGVSRGSSSGQITHALFYDDLINKLRFQGALVNDHNRLFSQDYYSFGLPIDLDKFINYQSYVWLSEGPTTISLLQITDVTSIQGLTSYTYVGNTSYVLDGTTVVEQNRTLPFTNGMKVKFTADVNAAIRNIEYFVEGVGKQIRFVSDEVQSYLSWESPIEWDSTVWDGNSSQNFASYVVMGRGSENLNPWSRTNRWVHKSVLELTNTVLTDINEIQAVRPILEFDYQIQLWNFATRSRGFINLIDTQTLDIDAIQGQMFNTVSVDGVALDDDMVILFTNLFDVEKNNRLYRVKNVRNYDPSVPGTGEIVLELLTNQDDITGAAIDGDGVFVMQGDQTPPSGISNLNSYWHFKQGTWIRSQNRQFPYGLSSSTAEYKAILNSSPLFELYDTDGVNLATYAQSSFQGCTLLEYKQDPLSTVKDPVLGITTVTENDSSRNFVFNVNITSDEFTYQQGLARIAIPGMKFYKTLDNTSQPMFINTWWSCAQASRQYVVNEFVSKALQREFTIDQMPDLSASAPVPITVSVGTTQLVLNQDYTVENKKVKLVNAVPANQFVKVRTWAGVNNTVDKGYFEVPPNLAANPNNQDLIEFSISSVIKHVESIFNNQIGFVGSSIGINNYRDTAQDQSLGTEILQHRAPLLKLMGMNAINQTDVFDTSMSVIDPFSAISWAQNEYLRFYNKVINSLLSLYARQGMTAADTPIAWLTKALAQVNVGKTANSTWANSGFDLVSGAYCSQPAQSPTWVPPSATRLGITPAYYPEVFLDQSQPNSPLSLKCHNGAVLVLSDFSGSSLGEISNNLTRTSDPMALTNPVSRAWLLFELRMYESLPAQYKDVDVTMPLDYRTCFSGKYRTTSYSRPQLLQLQSAAWQNWCTFNQVDAFRNTTVDLQNPFTWNYSSCVDKDQQPVPGHWRGIYFHFFDTDRPHIAPWEMLGFSQKPSWWDAEYGVAPYTSGNTHMWEDLELGRIAQGSRAGIHTVWARPGLSRNIPVDAMGGLLPPFAAGIITSLPTTNEANADWKFGDRSPLENVWLTSVDADIQWAQWLYLAKPAQFMEYTWDGTRQTKIFAQQPYSQWIYTDTLTRKSSAQFYVHRENPQQVVSLDPGSVTYYGSCGVQHWVSEKLISDSRNVTTYFGNVIRGLDVNLAHRLGGFTDYTSTKLMVESFGLTNNDSLLLPQEDTSSQLLRSASTGEYFYSGVIVEFKGAGVGWRVIGYDSVEPSFSTIPSDPRGPKNTVVIDNQRVVEYGRGLPLRQKIPYGTLFATRQEVYDFLISLGRAQAADGWIFDQFDSVAGKPRDWSLSAREFLFWSQGPWAPGTYIALSPLATLTKFKTEFGIIQNVGNIVNGAYSVLDRNGVNIQLKDVDFLRINDEIALRTLNDQGVFGLRLYTTTLEHAFIFNNRTVFNDLVYDPVLNQRQTRFKLFGFRTLEWTGRLEAPGYLVTQSVVPLGNSVAISNRIIPNFEKSVDDLRKLFEIDLSTPYSTQAAPNVEQLSTITQSLSVDLSRQAKHVVGYTARPYLTELLLDENVAFQFYQGMIHQKGTATAIDRLLRNSQVVKPDQEFSYFEEYAFRAGIYGNNSDVNSLDVRVPSTLVQSNPQLFEIFGAVSSDNPSDDVITIYGNDERIVTQSHVVQPFQLRTYYGRNNADLPTAGYVLMTEATYTVSDDAALQALYNYTLELYLADVTKPILAPGNIVWQFINTQRGWNIYKVYQSQFKILNTFPSDDDFTRTQVVTDSPHGLANDDLIIIYGVSNAGVVIDNTFNVTVTGVTTFEINISSTGVGSGGTALLYKSIRFNNQAERNSAVIPNGWAKSDITYVDGTSYTPWKVELFTGIAWITIRFENHKTDPDYISKSSLYDYTSQGTISNLTYWDPAKNKLPGIFDKEISYKTPYDPANYTSDATGVVGTNPQAAWGNDQVGLVWWDLSTTRFMDYEIGTNSYRRQYWGSIAPGTAVDIYEWVRSTVPPASWQDLVAEGTDLSAIGTTGAPSGQVNSPSQPYVVRLQLNSLNVLQVVYYFWVKNSRVVPDVPYRSIATSTLAALIREPANYNITWWAACGPTQALLGNVGALLNGVNTVWQLNWLSSLSTQSTHKEYTMLRPEDPRSSPHEYLWKKMQQSLVEFNPAGDSVPSLYLRPRDMYGIENSPPQSMFEDTTGARQAFVQFINQLLTDSQDPPAVDASRNSWRAFFDSQEPVPTQNVLEAVTILTTGNLDAYYDNGRDGEGARLIAKLQEELPLSGAEIGSRVLVKDQLSRAQNGVYVVVQLGLPFNDPLINSDDPKSNLWILERAQDFDSEQDYFTYPQVNSLFSVQEGVSTISRITNIVGGEDYEVGDRIQLLTVDYQTPGLVEVTSVTAGGGILTVELLEPGIYTATPETVIADTIEIPTRTGKDAVFTVEWSAYIQSTDYHIQDAGMEVASVTSITSGINYAVGDRLRLLGGVYQTPAIVEVTSVGEDLEILSVKLIDPGLYLKLPRDVFATESNSIKGQYTTFTVDWKPNTTFRFGYTPIYWAEGNAQATYNIQVTDLAAKDALTGQVPTNTRVLVDASGDTNNKWTIWEATGVPQAPWSLVRMQAYNTTQVWEYSDWYNINYSDVSILDYTFDTLADRDAYLEFMVGDLVKVLNTGDGTWAMWVYLGTTVLKWWLVGLQNGNIQLNDNLWDYETYRMGFDGGGFADDYQGFEYDSRLELDQIIQGLWVGAQGTLGLLQITDKVNEPNRTFFLMMNRVLSEQQFVDWMFKTSFINLRGFAEKLVASPFYTTNKINTLKEYINEIKPYHTQIRTFVDWRTGSETWTNNATDFDRPPYTTAQQQSRILDMNNPNDEIILSTNNAYKNWYMNYQVQPQLVRKLRTRLLFDRVACAASTWRNPQIDPNELDGLLALPVSETITSLSNWLYLIYENAVAENYKVSVEISDWVVMSRNTQGVANYAAWDFLDYGIDTIQTYGLTQSEIDARAIDVTVYNEQDLFNLITNQDISSGYRALVRVDAWMTLNIYIKQTASAVMSIEDWLLVTWQVPSGAKDRIDADYVPTASMLPKDHELLISGCASKLLTLDGAEFNNADAWDKTTWDSVRGWSYSDTAFDPYDQNIDSGASPGYWIYLGDGDTTSFTLPRAPQNPNNLKVWVNGAVLAQSGNWYIPNYAAQIYVTTKGINYNVNDVITVQGGVYAAPVTVKVTSVDLVGGIVSVNMLVVGDYAQVPHPAPFPAQGGSGVNAEFNILWGGDTIQFTTAPSGPVANRPNIWIVEEGSTFTPLVSSLLDNAFDGAGLNRAHVEPNHPEELNQILSRDSLIMDVYTQPSPGWGNLITKVYTSDGITNQFDIGQMITTNSQLFVYVNGVPQSWGVTEDYVIAFDSMRVVFVMTPPPGRISIISVGFGGASQGVGNFTITSPGSGYHIGNVITLAGGVVNDLQPARMQVTAVKATQIDIVNGGNNYRIGDLLLLKYGLSTETLSLKVTDVSATPTQSGIITAVEIQSAGNYTYLPTAVFEFFTNGEGTGAQLDPQWGVADMFVQDRGVYFQEAFSMTQASVIPSGGTGITINCSRASIKEQHTLVGDGITSTVQLASPANENTVLVTFNGDAIAFTLVGTKVINLGFAPAVGDRVFVTVYNSKLYSLINSNKFITTADTTYEITNTPYSSPVQSKNALVFANNVRLRSPYFKQGVSDGTVSYDMGIVAGDITYVTVWLNNVQLTQGVQYFASNGSPIITFATAPEVGTSIFVQIAENMDYLISGTQLALYYGVSEGDEIEVISFIEDSPTSFVNDQFEGSASLTYTLTTTPTNFGSLQVFVNGVLVDQAWDYQVSSLSNETLIKFGSQHTHVSTDLIEVYYPVRLSAQPGVAFRLFKNIFEDTQAQRLGDANVTTILEPVLMDSVRIMIADGTTISDPSHSSPGMIWIGSERITYGEKIATPTQEYPNRVQLGKLSRGTLGTSAGVNQQFSQESYNGDAQNIYFNTLFTSPYVIVDGVTQIENTHYVLEVNPPNLVEGTYVKFMTAPGFGVKNVLFLQRQTSLLSNVSHTTGSYVRDASQNQNLPGGYIWHWDNQGIQYGIQPQTKFLIENPGYRLV